MATNHKSKSAKSNETLELVLVFGQKKLPLLVSTVGSTRPGQSLTIGHLSDAVSEVAQVEPLRQKLIYRGRTLFKNEEECMKESFEIPLSSMGIKNGERIMLLCRKVSDVKVQADVKDKSPLNADEPSMDKLGELRAKLESINSRLDQEVKNGSSVQNDLPSFKSHRLRLRGMHEEAMKLLEAVDSTSPPQGGETDFRSQRKELVNALQKKLDELENHLTKVGQQLRVLEEQQGS